MPVSHDVGRYLTKAKRIRVDHRPRNFAYDKYERLYYKDHWETPPLDEADHQIVLPIHTLAVNTAHAILTGMYPDISAYPNKPSSQRDQNRADDVEKWHIGVDRENINFAESDPWAAAVFNQALFGVGVLREVYDFPKGWIRGDVDVFTLPRFPIVQQSLDPRQVYWERGNPPRGRFRTIFYEMEITLEDAEDLYGIDPLPRFNDKGMAQPLDYEERRTVIDWWEWFGGVLHHAIFLEVQRPTPHDVPGQWIKPPTPMPEYAYIPYHVFPFFETNSTRPEMWGLSILFPITDIPHWMEILASRQMRALELYADPVVRATRGSNNSDGPIPVETSPGTVLDLMQGDTVDYLQWSGSPPDVERLWNKFDEIIHEISFSKSLMANGSADATGFRTALDRETSLLKISKGMQNYELARTRSYAARAYAVGKLSPDTKIPVQGDDADEGHYVVSLPGSQIAAYQSIHLEIKPHFAGDLQRDVAAATAAVAGKMWSVGDAMDYIPTPSRRSKSATRDDVVKDMIEFNPQVIGARAEQIAARIKMDTQKMLEEMNPTPLPAPASPTAPPGMGGDIVGKILGGGGPGPSGGSPGLPGSPSAPGQPGGASPSSPQSGGLDNRLRPMMTGGASPDGGPPVGTTQPQDLINQILSQLKRPPGGA